MGVMFLHSSNQWMSFTESVFVKINKGEPLFYKKHVFSSQIKEKITFNYSKNVRMLRWSAHKVN